MPTTNTAPTTSATAAPTDDPANTGLCWRVHLLREQPRRLPRLLAAAAGVFLLALFLFHSLWLALLPATALLLSLSEFLFPAHYTLTARSAQARFGATALEIRWADVRHAYLTDEGIKLSPLGARNVRWEPLRGVFLRFGPDNRDEVIDAVRRLRGEAHSDGGGEVKPHG